jgi:hypothetical protein
MALPLTDTVLTSNVYIHENLSEDNKSFSTPPHPSTSLRRDQAVQALSSSQKARQS